MCVDLFAVMPKKQTFECNRCLEKHARPINSKCKRVLDSEIDSNSVKSTRSSSVGGSSNDDVNTQILEELRQLSGRLQTVEQKVNHQESGSRRSIATASAGSSRQQTERAQSPE